MTALEKVDRPRVSIVPAPTQNVAVVCAHCGPGWQYVTADRARARTVRSRHAAEHREGRKWEDLP